MRGNAPSGALLVIAVVAASTFPLHAASATEGSNFREAVSSNGGVVASVSAQAGEVGVRILDRGGNAVDAAVATTLAVGVTRPDLCGIGGGGFLAYRGADGEVATLDFREEAPRAITSDAYQGTGIYRSFTGHKTVGAPGTVAGMAKVAKRFGTMPLAALVRPARRLAARGVVVTEDLSASMGANSERLRLFPASARIYLVEGTAPYPPGSTLEQKGYARSLRLIEERGPRAFYRGRIARLIVRDMKENAGAYPGDDGLMRRGDLRRYRAKWRRPLQTTYRGHRVLAVGPPTSGGLLAIEMFNILKNFDVPSFEPFGADRLHYTAEAQKIAWADRDAYVADPDHADVPTSLLASEAYAAQRAEEIDRDQAKDYEPAGRPGKPTPAPGYDQPGAHHTTHVSVVDKDGNAVSVTCTVEFLFGSAVVAPGAGFILNNQLTDFSAPGTANEPEPGKRPRSSTTQLIVSKRGRPVAVLGGAGGPRIPMGVIMTGQNVMDFGLDLAHAIDAERLNEPTCCQMTLEDLRVGPETQLELERRGHRIVREGEYGGTPIVQAAGVNLETGKQEAVSDPRGEWGSAGQEKSRGAAAVALGALSLLAGLGLRRTRRAAET
ncbi:MAG TPA: gamma-glutamyltransferase [Actinomycetota bacterium]|nr:gamma-glutamyltransferase [Actinomycetota bacterium]